MMYLAVGVAEFFAVADVGEVDVLVVAVEEFCCG